MTGWDSISQVFPTHSQQEQRSCWSTFAIAAWPRMSSGQVGSSIQSGLNSASLDTQLIASATSHLWLASIIWRVTKWKKKNNERKIMYFTISPNPSTLIVTINRTNVFSVPIICLMRRHLRMSSSRSAPTFTLNFVHPCLSASVQSCRRTPFLCYIQSVFCQGPNKLRYKTFTESPLWVSRLSSPATHRKWCRQDNPVSASAPLWETERHRWYIVHSVLVHAHSVLTELTQVLLGSMQGGGYVVQKPTVPIFTLTPKLLALIRFYENVWLKNKEQTTFCQLNFIFCTNGKHVMSQPHPGPPPLWARPWCIWSQCMRQSAWGPALTHSEVNSHPCNGTRLNHHHFHVTHHVD